MSRDRASDQLRNCAPGPQRTLLDAEAGKGSTRRDRRETVSLAAVHALTERESACRTWENRTSSSCSRWGLMTWPKEIASSRATASGPELSNPMDPSSEPTGKTIFVLDEYYESPAGIARHWQDATDNWPDLSAAVAWGAKGTVATLHNGTALQALW